MAALSNFSEDISEEDLNTKIAIKYGLKNLKGKKKKSF